MDLLIGHNQFLDMQNDEEELGQMVDPFLLIQINDHERFSDDDLFQPHNFLGNLGNPADVQHENDDLLKLERTPNRDWDESLVISDSSYELDLFDENFPFREPVADTDVKISPQNMIQNDPMNISLQGEIRNDPMTFSLQDEIKLETDHLPQDKDTEKRKRRIRRRPQDTNNIRYQIKLELRKLRRLSLALNRPKVIVTQVEKKLRNLLNTTNVHFGNVSQK